MSSNGQSFTTNTRQAFLFDYLVGMLSFSDFNRLRHDNEGEFVFDADHCTYLMGYAESVSYSLNLYHATNAPDGAYFIERGRPAVWYNVEGNCIDSFRSFETHKALEPYLEFIDITQVWP